MINILSIRCGLAFAPYLVESLNAFIDEGRFAPRVIRQAGSGLIIRSDEQMMLRFQQREAALGEDEAKHYLPTIQFRREFYDVTRMQDEVVLANVGADLLLSHPQSDLWLEASHISHMLGVSGHAGFRESEADSSGVPGWLNISTGAGRLLLSDQRNGKWVLLASDHLEELERRLGLLDSASLPAARVNPPTIPLKGLVIHLQSALTVVATLESFADTGEVASFEEVTPTYSLMAHRSAEGIELRDSDRRVGLNRREARKYAGLVASELERLKVKQIERGGIRTVFADDEHGRWVLQWGDEVLVPAGSLPGIGSVRGSNDEPEKSGLKVGRTEDFLLLLSPPRGGCVALKASEEEQLSNSD
jgi:hypothetical protein